MLANITDRDIQLLKCEMMLISVAGQAAKSTGSQHQGHLYFNLSSACFLLFLRYR